MVDGDRAPPRKYRAIDDALTRGAIAGVVLCGLAAVVIPQSAANSLIEYYFFNQDVWLLSGGALALLILSRSSLAAAGAPIRMTDRQIGVGILLAAVIAYAGSYIVIERYLLTRDEIFADFAAQYLAQGHLGRRIPAAWQSVGDALMPWGGAPRSRDYWFAFYLPVNSALRALAGLLGDRWLAGPLLLAAGCAGLWSAARRIWPQQREPVLVAMILTLTSTQLLANAMTAYAMTAHFALNAIWLACFLRGGRLGHGSALVLGLLATGLHQFQFHVMFASGFIVWAYARGDHKVAALYALACCAYFVVWQYVYQRVVLDWALGPLQPGSVELPFGLERLIGYAQRAVQQQPVSSLARFAAWQNILLLPLAAVGTRAIYTASKRPTIMLGCAVSCTFGLLSMVYQGHGYGYRYLHGLIPCFSLLAAAGWVRLGETRGRPLPGRLLWASCGIALIFTAPIALTLSHRFLHPYAAAYRAVRAAPADVVFVDGRGAAFIEDIVRIDGAVIAPVLLDLSFVQAVDIARLCRAGRVMIFDRMQARALGMPAGGDTGDLTQHVVDNRRLMDRLHCGSPVPTDS